jgi:hypothetical protein
MIDELNLDFQTAKDCNTDRDRLLELARHSNLIIRQEVAKNRSTPVEILAELASDRSFLVRQAIADHPQAPASVLVALFEDPETNNRNSIEAIAGHPNTPEKVLRKLIENEQHWGELYKDCPIMVIVLNVRQLRATLLYPNNFLFNFLKMRMKMFAEELLITPIYQKKS